MGIPILKTKLFAPEAAEGLVRRDRLFAQLDAGLDGRLLLVSAPAGFGKTTLVARWIEDRGRRAAWYSVERADDSPTRFWSYLVAALGEVPNTDVSETTAILGAATPDTEAVVVSLINELAELDATDPTVLVLDDLHTIDSEPVLESLEAFLDHLPRSVRVVVTTRTDPKLPLSRYRARGEMTEVRQDDLRFSGMEIDSYLNEILGFGVEEESVASLERRTEGWAVSLQLAALSMRRLDPDERDRFVRDFAGDDRFIMDYLLDEVLLRQPEPVQRFLLATSVLDRMNSRLCESLFAMVVPDQTPPSLEELERAGLFLTALDRRREWYRFHHLFADLLRVRCRAEMDAPALLRRASEWHEAEGLVEEAIEYGFRTGDAERPAVVLETHFRPLIGRGESRVIRRTIERLPVDRVHASTGLCMAMAYVEYLSTNLDAAEAWIARCDAVLATNDPSDTRLEEQRAHLNLLRAFRAEAEQKVDESRQLYEAAREGFKAIGVPYLECVGERGLAGALLAEERLEDCELVGRGAWTKGLETGNFLAASTAMNHMTTGWIAQGRLRYAAEACREHIEEVRERTGGGELMLVGYAQVGLVAVLIRQNRLDEASNELDEVEVRSRQANLHSLTARVLIERLRLALAREQYDEARRASGELKSLFDGDKVLFLVQRLYEALAVRLRLAEGEISAAVEWSASSDDQGSFPTVTRMAQADVLRAQGEHRAAIALLEQAERGARAAGALGWALEAMTRRAMALHALRDYEALGVVADALELAEPEDFSSPFLDEGPDMAVLISQAQAQGALKSLRDDGFVPRLFSAFEERGATEEPRLLSDRELEVLRLLEAGLSNKAVGERLFISLGTVKRHTHNIYQKLGAARRSEALLMAREVGIL